MLLKIELTVGWLVANPLLTLEERAIRAARIMIEEQVPLPLIHLRLQKKKSPVLVRSAVLWSLLLLCSRTLGL
jgi:hypothetical protein